MPHATGLTAATTHRSRFSPPRAGEPLFIRKGVLLGQKVNALLGQTEDARKAS